MRVAIVASTVLFAACVKAPHEVALDYAEFDKAPDYVWQGYSSAKDDEARQTYWQGYQGWVCPHALDAAGNWKSGESASVQRQVACDRFQRERRQATMGLKNDTFQSGLAEVEIGMAEEDVKALLGRPWQIDQSDDVSDTGVHWTYRDASRKRTVLHLHFRDGLLERLGN